MTDKKTLRDIFIEYKGEAIILLLVLLAVVIALVGAF